MDACFVDRSQTYGWFSGLIALASTDKASRDLGKDAMTRAGPRAMMSSLVNEETNTDRAKKTGELWVNETSPIGRLDGGVETGNMQGSSPAKSVRQ